MTQECSDPKIICTAPKGKVRIIYHDSADGNWPVVQCDCASVEKVDAELAHHIYSERVSMAIYNDAGERIRWAA